MLAGDTHPHLVDVDVGLVGGLVHSAADRFGGLGDVLHDAMFYALGFGLAETEDFHFTGLATHTDEASDFGGTDV